VRTNDAQDIVLLFGMPRSGTTWVGKILDSHHAVYYRHEPDTWSPLRTVPLEAPASDWRAYRNDIQDYVAAIVAMKHPNVDCKLPQFAKSYLSPIENALYLSTSKAAKLLAPLGLETAYYKPNYRDPGCTVVWKSIQYLCQLGIYLRCLPAAMGIHLIRHPCGYISSVLRGEQSSQFSSPVPEAEDFELFGKLLKTNAADRYALDLESIRDMSPVERLAWRWVLANEKCLLDTKDQTIHRLVYEELCAQPMSKAKELFAFCNLPWSSQSEAFLEESTIKDSDSYYSVYKNPLQSANKWQTEMPHLDIRKVEKILLGTLIQEHHGFAF